MKPTDLMGSGEVRLTGNAVAMNGLAETQTPPHRTRLKSRIRSVDRSTFPARLFLASYIVTGTTILWALLNYLKAGLLSPQSSTLTGTARLRTSGLAAARILAWSSLRTAGS